LALVAFCVCLGCLAGLIPLLSIYLITARYLLDVSAMLTLLAGIGAWIAYSQARTRTSQILVGLAIASTALVSVAASVLLTLNNWLR
jgi:hypothetical protein